MRKNTADGEERNRKRPHFRFWKLKLLGVVLVVACTGVAGMKIGASWQKNKAEEENHAQEITADVLEQQMQQIGELSTVKYFYTNMARFEDTKTFLDYNIPLTTKSFTISYDGVIRAGVDLDGVSFFIRDDDASDSKVITIRVPEATIQSHDVDMDSVTVYDEKSSIFNELETEDVVSLLGDQEDMMEEKAINNGILEEANENAKNTLSVVFNELVNNGEFEEGYLVEVVTEE